MKNVAVIMGGYSPEYDISIQSGEVVCRWLPKNRYHAYGVHILKDKWVHITDEGAEFPVDRSDFSFSDGAKAIRPDVVFNAIHGTPGEDGLLQAYFELLGIRHTSCGPYQAALTFDKRDCLTILKSRGIRCATSYYLDEGDPIDPEAIIGRTGLPCFVKPNRSGSSFGVSKVTEREALLPAIDKAFEEDNEILIETGLVGTEVSVGIIPYQEKTKVLPPTEIVPKGDFFDYEAKYLGASEEITPARIPDTERQALEKEAERVYRLLKMTGMARCDFIIQAGQPYFIEINTNPGLSEASLLPQQAKAAGISLGDLFSGLIEAV